MTRRDPGGREHDDSDDSRDGRSDTGFSAPLYDPAQYGTPSYGSTGSILPDDDPWWDTPAPSRRDDRRSSGYTLPGMAGVDDPWAPYGRDPATGTPLSSRSMRTAGLLQLTLGGFGAGRFYLGHHVIGLVQLLVLVGSWYLTVTHPLGVYALLGLATWTLVDSITMLSGGMRDGGGLVLRP